MKQAFHQVVVPTQGRGFYDITDSVSRHLAASLLTQGLATLHLQHTSASLLIQENADPNVRGDFDRFFAALVPDGDPMFLHTEEGDDDMSAHIRTALTAVNLSIPFDQGRLCLGTWQGIYVWEHRARPHTRKVALHLLGE